MKKQSKIFLVLRDIFFYGAAALLLASLFSSCKKEEQASSPGCWTCYDAQHSAILQACGKDEQDAFNHTGQLNGQHTLENFRASCQKQ